jgi:hypothetical protein
LNQDPAPVVAPAPSDIEADGAAVAAEDTPHAVVVEHVAASTAATAASDNERNRPISADGS